MLMTMATSHLQSSVLKSGRYTTQGRYRSPSFLTIYQSEGIDFGELLQQSMRIRLGSQSPLT